MEDMNQLIEKKLLGVTQSSQLMANYRKNRGLSGSRIQSVVRNQGKPLKQSNIMNLLEKSIRIQNVKTINSIE